VRRPLGRAGCSTLKWIQLGLTQPAVPVTGTTAPRVYAREEHITPAGAVQPFTWAAFRQQARGYHEQPPGRGHLDRVTG
jgi:hypothetical protein